MSLEIRMPRLVDTMTEGSIVAWRVREGEPVTAGAALAEIEVCKTTVDLKAPDGGTLTRIVVATGSEKVEVGAVLAILEPGGGPALTVIEVPVSRSFRGDQGEGGQPDRATGWDSDPVRA